MEAFVITIKDNPKSVKAAERCIRTGKINGVAVSMFTATTPKDPIYEMLKERDIDHTKFEDTYSRKDNSVSCFLSHMRLWEYCFNNKKEILILEHDAVFQSGLPKFLNYNKCLTIGQPSYGQFKLPVRMGVQPLTQKEYFKGAHSYLLKPSGAQELILQTKKDVKPADVFLNTMWFPWLEELYPWVCEAQDTFTTVQAQQGCVAKHKYNSKYEVINV